MALFWPHYRYILVNYNISLTQSYIRYYINIYIYIYTYILDISWNNPIIIPHILTTLYIYIFFTNLNLAAIWGWFPLLTMISSEGEQWGRYNLPRYIYIYIYETKLHLHSGNQLNPATSPQNPPKILATIKTKLATGFCQQNPFLVHQNGDLTKKTLDLTQRKWALNMIGMEICGCMMFFFSGFMPCMEICTYFMGINRLATIFD